jgi:imidazolonepropionase-like amidohydrolase
VKTRTFRRWDINARMVAEAHRRGRGDGRLYDDMVQLYRAAGIAVVPTVVYSAFAERLARAGVTIGIGTDIWQVPSAVHLELEELVAAGLTPLEAIRAATGDAARILGAADLGTIAVGKVADLVVLDADRMADIRNTRRIRAVVQGGRVVDRARIREAAGAR